MTSPADTTLLYGFGRVFLTFTRQTSLSPLPTDTCILEGMIDPRSSAVYFDVVLWNPFEAMDGGTFVHHGRLPRLAIGDHANDAQICDLIQARGPDNACNLFAEARASGVYGIDHAHLRRKLDSIAPARRDAAGCHEVGKVFPVEID